MKRRQERDKPGQALLFDAERIACSAAAVCAAIAA